MYKPFSAALLCFAIGIPVHAAFLPISTPDAGYIGSTTLIPIASPDLTVLSSLSNPTLTITFSTGLQARTVPTTWSTWAAPPNAETPTPRVLDTPINTQTLLTLTFSKPLSIFGLEAEPDAFQPGVVPMTANFFNGATNVGTITLNVNSSAGSRLFAASSTAPTGPFTSVNITAVGTDFAIAQLRYQVAPTVPGVPEPGTWLGLASGLVALAGYRKLRHVRELS